MLMDSYVRMYKKQNRSQGRICMKAHFYVELQEGNALAAL